MKHITLSIWAALKIEPLELELEVDVDTRLTLIDIEHFEVSERSIDWQTS